MGLVDQFLTFMELNKGRSARLREVYRLHLARLDEFMGGLGRSPLQATGDDLLAFTGAYLFKLGLRDPVSRRPAVSAVRGFFKWANGKRLVRSNPADDLPQPKVGRKIPVAMTLVDAERLMYAPDFSTFVGVRDAAMLSLLAGCGLRASGLAGLNESDLIHDQIGGRQRMVLRTREKGDKERLMPVPEQAALMLRLYLDHPELEAVDRLLPDGDRVLFVTTARRNVEPHEYRGEARRFCRKGVFDLVQRNGRKAGLSAAVAHPHALRHTFGTELAESDVPTVTSQKLLGHADPKSTEIYQQLAMRKLVEVMDRANPLAKISTPAGDLLRQLQK